MGNVLLVPVNQWRMNKRNAVAGLTAAWRNVWKNAKQPELTVNQWRTTVRHRLIEVSYSLKQLDDTPLHRFNVLYRLVRFRRLAQASHANLSRLDNGMALRLNRTQPTT